MDHDVIIESGDNVRCLYNEILSESETYSREHNICEFCIGFCCEFCIGFCIRIIIELVELQIRESSLLEVLEKGPLVEKIELF